MVAFFFGPSVFDSKMIGIFLKISIFVKKLNKMNAQSLDIEKMNDLELKGMLHGFIEKAKNRKQLLRVFEALQFSTDEDALFWKDYTVEQKAEIEQAIEESYDPKNWVSHDEVMKKYEKWLRK
jgi:hypothetical protein